MYYKGLIYTYLMKRQYSFKYVQEKINTLQEGDETDMRELSSGSKNRNKYLEGL